MPVLDAWAIMAYLGAEEPAGSKVRSLLEDRNGLCRISWINLGEVLYTLGRRSSLSEAEQVVRKISGVVDPVEATPTRTLAAARIKATHRLSYADAFAVATAAELAMPLWTGDPEILVAEVGIEVIDLR